MREYVLRIRDGIKQIALPQTRNLTCTSREKRGAGQIR